MRRVLGVLVLVLAPSAGSFGGPPVTKAQLLEMGREKVASGVILALVERDCVDFEVNATNAAELSREIPAEVLGAAIRCRERGPAAAPTSSPAPSPTAPPPAAPAVMAPPGSSSAPAGLASLRVRAEFIGEAGALTCTCSLDEKPFAILSKPEQGEFGQAVARDPIRRESEYLPVEAGRHTLLFRCDPKGQQVTATVELKAGEKKTVEIGETMFRHWRVRKVE